MKRGDRKHKARSVEIEDSITCRKNVNNTDAPAGVRSSADAGFASTRMLQVRCGAASDGAIGARFTGRRCEMSIITLLF